MAKYQKTFHNIYCFTDEFLKDTSSKKDVNLLKPFKRGEPNAQKNVVEFINSIFKSNPKSAAVKCVKAKDPVTFNGYYPSLPYIVWDIVCVSDDKTAFDFVESKIAEYYDELEKTAKK